MSYEYWPETIVYIIFAAVVVCAALVIPHIPGMLTAEINETEPELFAELQQDHYYNITILDKQMEERSFRSDVYNVVFKYDDGNITKLNNMDLYYSVEEGKSYNASFRCGFKNIVGEI